MAFEAWNRGPLKSYLIEITGEVGPRHRPGDRPARSSTSSSTAPARRAPAAGRRSRRSTSARRRPPSRRRSPRATSPPRLEERAARGGALPARLARRSRATPALVDRLEEALLAGKIACYAQGFGLLAAASAEFGWSLPLAGIARVWRAGCIIRSAMLDDMARALEADAGTQPDVRAALRRDADRHPRQPARRRRRRRRSPASPTPALAAALGYFDMMRTAPLAPRTSCRPSATSSARTASSGSTGRAPSTAPGAATPRSTRSRRSPPCRVSASTP